MAGNVGNHIFLDFVRSVMREFPGASLDAMQGNRTVWKDLIP